MRDFKGMKRQRGRNRGGGGSGGGKPTQNANRAFDSNGPDGVKVRGNAQHVFEKYQQLARDANAAGDRVLGENYLQHAEHYFRLLRALQPSRSASEIIGRDQFASGYDIDFEDESGQQAAMAADEAAAEGGEVREDGEGQRDRDQNRDQNRDRPRDRDRDGRGDYQARDGEGRRDRWRDGEGRRDRDGRDRNRDRNRDDRPRDDRPRAEGDERPRDERPRDDRPRDERPRDERPRDDRPREDRPRFERDRRDREDRPERDPLAVVQPTGDAEPRGPLLRDSEGGASHAPAFLQATRPVPAPAAAADDEAKPKARRRRAPRSFEAGEGAPAPAESED
ncbi:DUF4167 domain-containing protein [Phenylobacterium sp.]|uniref:DUF4167 domain-containing protein n=1 Tax=Phenylobacterium sp. TaxID=1871053 RepID=UPI002ED8EB7E